MMSESKKTMPVVAAALAVAVAMGAATEPLNAAVREKSSNAVVIVDEDGRITAPIAVDELGPSDSQIV
jgi:uncharacterized membrane protein